MTKPSVVWGRDTRIEKTDHGVEIKQVRRAGKYYWPLPHTVVVESAEDARLLLDVLTDVVAKDYAEQAIADNQSEDIPF